MIGWLRGVLRSKQAPELLLDVGGVGFEVHVSLTTFYELPAVGESVELYTHHVVREDAQLLFGFLEQRERRLFRALIKVNGVGPRLALTILSGMEPDRFVAAVLGNDSAALVKLPGVGKKTAERLLVEMRDRLEDGEGFVAAARPASAADEPGTPYCADEAESALLALGYKPQEASRAVAAAIGKGPQSTEQLIRLALQGMLK